MHKTLRKSENFKIVVCASGGGGNFQSIIDTSYELGIDISLLIVDRSCNAISRAITHSIPYIKLNTSNGREEMFTEFEKSIPKDIDLIVLAGFMPIIPSNICDKWNRKIINTHPSLLPKYGGKGMYGVKVQEKVIQANERFAGCTVHFVNAAIDKGDIILQKSIPVYYNETPWELGGRIFKEENKLLVEAIRLIKNNIIF